jgi:two-component system NtrC family sensor kinase
LLLKTVPSCNHSADFGKMLKRCLLLRRRFRMGRYCCIRGNVPLMARKGNSMGQEKEVFPEKETFDPLMEKFVAAYVQRYRHAAIGSLTEGIAHNLNGVLQILSMRTELLQGSLMTQGESDIPAVHQKVGQCFDQIQKMKTMVEALVQKGIHDDQDGPQRIDLNDLLEEELSLQKHNLFVKHEIVVRKGFASELPPLHGYYIDFSQGLSSLIQNAVEAMEESPQKELTVTTESQGHQINVRIRDTGCGLSEEAQPHLFRPFFTTKGEKHFGLGLFISGKILATYGASFRYHFQNGETTFWVNLPV